ncbi:SDR family oxidoreductase [Pseudomonas syringae]|nr:SDR family oxidoreductase [Pseudomonas syringae]MCF5771286.1 SDR family oxidoreductase [Pseudomonas syringae]
MEKVLIITGGSRGIGAATARLAAKHGYRICINYMSDRASAEKTAAQVRAQGAHAITMQADVSNEDEIIRLFARVDSELGRVTHLVNNAGTLAQASRVEDMSEFRMLKMMMNNVVGPMLCSKHALLRMLPRHGGHGGSIVNVSSLAARLGSAGEYVDYAASKGALDTFTIGLSREVAGEGIRVNAVRPGFIFTDFHALSGDPLRVSKLEGALPMGRGGTPEEVAEAIIWLLSDQASYATGTFIDVAGGRCGDSCAPPVASS